MRMLWVWMLALCVCVFAADAWARSNSVPDVGPFVAPGQHPDGMAPAAHQPSRADTLWFGGDDGTGHALFSPDLANPDDALWTWDSGSADPFEGWVTQDMSTNDGVYFYRVNAASFSGDFCVPMFPGEAGELWCGMHEAAADAHDWVGGMGYGNDFCQSAKSPYLTCVGRHNIAVNWKMFNDSEPLYDYTYLYVLAYDNAATPNLLEEIEVASYDGIVGSHTTPVNQTRTMLAAELPTTTAKVKVEFRFFADGGWADDDGYYLTACGPFAADQINITVTGGGTGSYDFEATAEGWTFDKCAGAGTFMAVWPQEVWEEWITTVNLPCPCSLTENVLGCVDEESPFPVPGHPSGQLEQMASGICTLDRNLYPPTEYNTTIAEYDAYFYMRQAAGSFYRPGYKYYPYTSVANPTPHWSQRLGQDLWYHSGIAPGCYSDLQDGLTLQGLPRDWVEMRYIFEYSTDCEAFGITPQNCRFEGQTYGAPLIDNLRIGISGSVDAPAIALDTGHLFTDGFGQNFPTYLEPGDVGNSNVSYDNSRDDEAKNDWHGDSAMIQGPMPSSRSWLCDLMIYVETKGPRQDMVPGYQYWKSRLQGNPEVGWVAVTMDSAQQSQQLVSNQAFSTYFHEDDPGFRGSPPADYNEINEILPDGVFTPGTTIDYYYAPYWIDTPDLKGYLGPTGRIGWEFQTLPQMRLVAGSDWDVEWPGVLYVDAFNGGSEVYIIPTLGQLELDFDKYDALNRSSNYDAPLKRSFRGGSWGNNGCTTQQLLGYRLVLYNTGTLDAGSMPIEDFELFDEWLDATDCPDVATTRRGLILDGDQIGSIMDHPDLGVASDFMNQKLGAQYVADSYRTYNNDEYDCVGLLASGSAVFMPATPGASTYGNACPTIYDYNILGTHATGGIASVGNLLYKSYNEDATNSTVAFAQVVRDMSNQASTNWKSVVDGFSFHHLSEYSGVGDECEGDSTRIVDGAGDMMGPMLQWITDVNDPFVYWRYPCEDSAIDEDTDGHLAGKVNYLYASRPNPFRNSATIRFQLANAGHVELSIYDVTGRLVRTLVDGDLKAGENSLVWDGTDNASNRVSGGVFWMQMSTNGFTSSKKMVVLR